jgi:hypothetical protein
MADVVKEPLNVAGLLTNIYSRSDLRDNDTSEPVVVLFFLHGRGESADTVDTVARAAFAWAAQRQASSKHKPRDFIVVTFVRGFLSSGVVYLISPSESLITLAGLRWAGPAKPWQEDGG